MTTATLHKTLISALALLLGAGCAIRTGRPDIQVVYDDSDAHFFDRGYATSPQWQDRYVEHEEPLRLTRTPSVGDQVPLPDDAACHGWR